METKICKHCQFEKPLKSFNANKNKSGGVTFGNYCNTCRSRRANIKKFGRENKREQLYRFCEASFRWFRKCTKCHTEKPIEDFAKDNGKPTPSCLECRRKATKHWLENMPEEGRKAYYHHRNTSPKMRDYRRKRWDAMTQEERREFYRRYDTPKNRAKKNAAARERKRKANMSPEEWRAFLDRSRDSRTKQRMRRRAREKAAVVIPFTKGEIIARDGCECYLCNKELTYETATIDHVIPLSRGGWHCPSNAKIACEFCNKSKGKKTLDEFLEWRAA
ncbi:MAG TPA: HNH endonuclease [Pyrinomonadaceae bacterium]|jgi:hypothetical protein